MNIVYCLTVDYVRKAVPSMRSLLEHNPKAKIYLLTEVDPEYVPETGIPMTVINIAKMEKERFMKSVNLLNNFGGAINLMKVCYPEILPKLKKVIHLDVDAIVCDSLEEMWKTDLTGKWFAAVQERKGRYHPFGPDYFNAGVMVINLEQMRKDGIVPEMVEYLNKVKQPFADQDAWNLYALEDDKAVELPVRYNENFATGYTDDPAIVHFCGISGWWTDKNMFRREYLDKYMEKEN